MSMNQFAQGEEITSFDVEMGELSINQTTFNSTSQDIDDSNAKHEDITSLDMEMGELSIGRGAGGGPAVEMGELSIGGVGLSKNNFEPWAKALVTVPFTITIAIVASLLASNGNEYFKLLASFPLSSFFFVVMLNFYAAVIAIIIRHRFPLVARGLYVVAFFCGLSSLTMLFAAILPNVMNVVPWIFLAIVALLLISQVLYENRRY